MLLKLYARSAPLPNLLAIMQKEMLNSYVTESAPKILGCHFRNLDNGPRRIP